MDKQILEKFLPLIFAIWAIFQSGLDTDKYLNELRDRIIDPKSKLTYEHKVIIYHDWKGTLISIGSGHLLLLALMIFLSIVYFPNKTENDFLSFIISIVLCLVVIIRIIDADIKAGWFRDRIAIEHRLVIIKKVRKNKKKQNR